MAQRLDFFLFIGSLYTYIAVMRVGEAAAKAARKHSGVPWYVGVQKALILRH
jgi:hypothetical protein